MAALLAINLEKDYPGTMQKLGAPALMLTSDGKIIQANQEFSELVGMPVHKLLAMSLTDCFVGCKVSQWDNYWNKLRAMGSLTFPAALSTTTNQKYNVEIQSHFLAVGNRELSFVLVIDARQLWANRLLQSKVAQLHRLLSDKVRNSLTVISLKGQMVRLTGDRTKISGIEDAIRDIDAALEEALNITEELTNNDS